MNKLKVSCEDAPAELTLGGQHNTEKIWVGVLLSVPIDTVFTYQWPPGLPAPVFGQRVLVPFGRRTLVGLVQGLQSAPAAAVAARSKVVLAVLDDGALLRPHWQALVEFAARYYHHPLGEVALEVLPKALRSLGPKGQEPAMVRKARELFAGAVVQTPGNLASPAPSPSLSTEQAQAVQAVLQVAGFGVHLLHGVTGSGKTEVFMHLALHQVRAGQQVLVLLPEINLTPAACALYRERLAPFKVGVLHSGLAEGERTRAWFEAATGHADVLIGTRLAVFTPMPRLGLVVVDEEHDPSYKQQDGMRYHARDMAVMLAKQRGIAIVLGSATPSLESWHKAQVGAYHTLSLTQRAVQGAVLPTVELINTAHGANHGGISERARVLLQETLERGGQSLVFLNRRGYAPQLACGACGWVANCTQCSAHVVWHKSDALLRCHHCGAVQAVPRHCPTCGNQDLSAFGRGTQRIEETLQVLLPTARVLRIDADNAKTHGAMQSLLGQVHGGEADVLVGTQMIAKGHDFGRVQLVLALNVDASLFSHAYRAPERLFAQLMQVAGRAGRHGGHAQVAVQTRYPHHPLFTALVAHNYAQFAEDELENRRQAAMPPFGFQATLRADHRQLARAMEFLQAAKEEALQLAAKNPSHAQVFVADPLPLPVVRVANVERAQLLLEAAQRSVLQGFLNSWLPLLKNIEHGVRWFVEVDPLDL